LVRGSSGDYFTNNKTELTITVQDENPFIIASFFFTSDRNTLMAQSKWFRSIESMFYDALYYHDLSGWYIEPMPSSVSSYRRDLSESARHGYHYRTHNAVAR
jgi:hypothetical protein